MLNKRTGLFFFAFLKDAAGAALQKAALGSDRPKCLLRIWLSAAQHWILVLWYIVPVTVQRYYCYFLSCYETNHFDSYTVHMVL